MYADGMACQRGVGNRPGKAVISGSTLRVAPE
jgi:hypothetical protein